jgi:hypothetical protein
VAMLAVRNDTKIQRDFSDDPRGVYSAQVWEEESH